MNILSSLLLPLVVATPFTEREKEGMDPLLWIQAENPLRQCEPEVDIIKMLMEGLILLCQTRRIRQELRAKKVYVICRNHDYASEDDGVHDLMQEIVNFLERDEDVHQTEEEEREALRQEQVATEATTSATPVMNPAALPLSDIDM